jgi:hypothetical protein
MLPRDGWLALAETTDCTAASPYALASADLAKRAPTGCLYGLCTHPFAIGVSSITAWNVFSICCSDAVCASRMLGKPGCQTPYGSSLPGRLLALRPYGVGVSGLPPLELSCKHIALSDVCNGELPPPPLSLCVCARARLPLFIYAILPGPNRRQRKNSSRHESGIAISHASLSPARIDFLRLVP